MNDQVATGAHVSVGHADGGRGLLADLAFDGLLIFVFVLLAVLLESTTLGSGLLSLQYKYLQSLLRPPPIEVAILDISDLDAVEQVAGGAVRRITPRDKLLALIDAVASHQPDGIALDINFAPYANDPYISPKDPEFFDECLEYSNDKFIPVYLGVNRADPSEKAPRRPEQLAKNKRYAPLIAGIIIYRDTRTLPSDCEYAGQRMKSFSAAMAEIRKERQPTSGFWSWFAERRTHDKHGLYFIDYSPLNQLCDSRDHRLRSINPDVVRSEPGEIFKKRLVFIGKATPGIAQDTFTVPVLPERDPVPGIYIHACGTNTLVTEPLYELTHLGRIVVDITLSTLVLGLVTLVRYRQRVNEAATARLEFFFTVVVAAVAILVGVVFVRVTRVLWSDFLVVSLVLVFHPLAKPYLVGTAKGIVHACRWVWDKLLRGLDPE